MILQILFSLIYIIAVLLFAFLPPGDILPWGLDPIFLNASMFFRTFMDIFWPLEIVLNTFLLYLGFLIAMRIMKLFIGHRAPVQ